MRWISAIATRVKDEAVDRILRNHDERIRQIVKHLSGPEEDYHGDRKMILSAGLGLFMTSAGAHVAEEISPSFDWSGRFNAGGAGYIAAIPLPLRVGTRIKSLAFGYYADGNATVRASLIQAANNPTPSILKTETATTSGYQTLRLTVNPSQTIETGDRPMWAQFRTGQNLDRFYSVEVTYDRPSPGRPNV